MTRNKITFDEKVAARYERGPRDACWLWTGGTLTNRPSLNMRHVGRYIYEQEFGPIPEGYLLWRDDHTPTCKGKQYCRHTLCVNPYHVRLVSRSGFGRYSREALGRGTDWVIDDPSRIVESKRKYRGNGNKGNPEDQGTGRDAGRDAGVRLGESDIGESDRAGDSG